MGWGGHEHDHIDGYGSPYLQGGFRGRSRACTVIKFMAKLYTWISIVIHYPSYIFSLVDEWHGVTSID